MLTYYGYSIDEKELRAVNSIGVLCWGLIGDVFMRVPIIEALRCRFPQARITVIVEPSGYDVLINHPACNQIITLAHKRRMSWRYWQHLVSLVYKLRCKRFDLFVNLYSGGSSTTVTRLINARIRLGFDHTHALRSSNNLLVKTPSFCQHWSKALGAKLLPLGISDREIRRGSSFYVTDTAKMSIEKYLPNTSRFVAINLGAGVAAKRWSVANYVAVAKRLAQNYQLQPLVFTNPGMEELAGDFMEQYGTGCMIAPVLSLDEIGALMLRSVAVITGDTALMHLAIAIKIPNLVLFTDTRPEIVAPEDCIHVACFIEDTQRINSCGKPPGIVDIPVDYVVNKFAELLGKIHISL